ncbi:ATP synthase subunit b, mitochondrial-like [Musca vetustissima]|uniref:ATP synthase subunit b, mitochondrial-like n=1 Tax=Musca vetustissima TaxID=27455 RepID=UPI002AB6CE12|nr:ATP synthase subunit b, mitochondrial-like [Musca vetustissima]
MILKPSVILLTSKCLNILRNTSIRAYSSIASNKKPEACNQKRPIDPAKVRMGFLPDDWFTFFYNKTGVTGPYIFGLGLLNYLFSKEIYICEHEFYNGISMALLCIAAVKKLGPLVADYCDKEIEKIEEKWKQMHAEELKALENLIEHERKEQWRAEGSLLLMQMKKENIALQLEEAHRKAMMKVFEDVKHRLDYQVECRNIEMRISHKHMVNWVVNKVLQELPEARDESLKEKYRADLSAMALRIKN